MTPTRETVLWCIVHERLGSMTTCFAAGYIACSIKNKENIQLFEEGEKESHVEIRIETKSLFNSTN